MIHLYIRRSLQVFDIVFISYDEPHADENWQYLKERIPYAKRIHGIKGIDNAHKEAAKIVDTEHFFTIDGDNKINENFNFNNIIDFQRNDKRIHVWRAENCVNGLIYGYGGVKLWPTDHIKNIKEYTVDFTTSVATHGFKIHNELASKTCFNSTPYNAWKSGYRECTKLASGIIHNADKKSLDRLLVWMSIGSDVENGLYCILGARMGALYGFENNNPLLLSQINDFDWCQKQFNNLDFSSITIQIDEIGNRLKKYIKNDILLLAEKESKYFKNLLYKV